MTRQSYFCAQLSLRRKMGSKRKALVPVLQPNALWLGIADPFITRPLRCSPLNAADIGGTQNKGYKRGVFYIGATYFPTFLWVFGTEYNYFFLTSPKNVISLVPSSVHISQTPYFPWCFIFSVATQEIKSYKYVCAWGIFLTAFLLEKFSLEMIPLFPSLRELTYICKPLYLTL